MKILISALLLSVASTTYGNEDYPLHMHSMNFISTIPHSENTLEIKIQLDPETDNAVLVSAAVGDKVAVANLSDLEKLKDLELSTIKTRHLVDCTHITNTTPPPSIPQEPFKPITEHQNEYQCASIAMRSGAPQEISYVQIIVRYEPLEISINPDYPLLLF